MSAEELCSFPTHFRLKSVTAITSTVFELKYSPNQKEAACATMKWFDECVIHDVYLSSYIAHNSLHDYCYRHDIYHNTKKATFLSHGFDSYTAMAFPDADAAHLETCMAFLLWAFSVGDAPFASPLLSVDLRTFLHAHVQFDDLSDEGELQSKPGSVQIGVDISIDVLRNPDGPIPSFPYAAMLHTCVFHVSLFCTIF